MNSCECLFDNCKFGGMHESLSTRRPPHHPYSHLLWFLTSLDAVTFFTPLDTARLFFEGGRGRSDSVGLRGGVFKELRPRLSSAHTHTQLVGSERLPSAPRRKRERDRRLASSVVRVPALPERDPPAVPRDLVSLEARSRAIASFDFLR